LFPPLPFLDKTGIFFSFFVANKGGREERNEGKRKGKKSRRKGHIAYRWAGGRRGMNTTKIKYKSPAFLQTEHRNKMMQIWDSGVRM
jgi:hypothetical protein